MPRQESKSRPSGSVVGTSNMVDHRLRREENKFEFLEGRFLDEKLPFLHKKKAEHSFELSLSIFCLLTVYF